MHLRDVLDPVDVFRKVLHLDLQGGSLQPSCCAGAGPWAPRPGLRFMQRLIRFYHPSEVRLLTNWWHDRVPDMAVSVVPNFNRALFDAWRQVAPGRPYVTVLTDLADFPPRFWMERQRSISSAARHARWSRRGRWATRRSASF